MNLPPVLRQYYSSSNGAPLAGGLLYTYQAGTSTPQATYTDSTGVTPNTNPIVLDASGGASMWLDPSLSYKFVLQDSLGSTQWTQDNVIGLITANAVATVSIQDAAVTSSKLAPGAVNAAALESDASVDGNRPVNTNNIRDSAITFIKIAAAAAQQIMPSGSILAYGGAAAPTGWLLCDGTAYSRTASTYQTLFSILGTSFGNGDGSTTFNVPDARGLFLRGVTGASANDPDASARTAVNGGHAANQVGSYQSDQVVSHNHGLNGTADGAAMSQWVSSADKIPSQAGFTTPQAVSTFGGNETRPKNLYVNYIIKL